MARAKRQVKRVAQVEVAPWRFYTVAALLLVLGCVLVFRIVFIQVLDVERGYTFLQKAGDQRAVRSETIHAHRGMIADRNGEPLAISTPVMAISATPVNMSLTDEQLGQLAKALGKSKASLADKLKRYEGRQYVSLGRHLLPSQVAKVKALKLKGVYQEREYQRFYPAGEVVAQLLGLTRRKDDKGQSGLEMAYDHWLAAANGRKRVLQDLHGKRVRELGEGDPAKAGKDLFLSVDLRLQTKVYQILSQALEANKAKAGSITILDVATGEVLAMVNLPAVNPNNRRSLDISAMRNRAVTDMFEPGSTVKPFTIAAAIQSGEFEPDAVLDTHPGHITIGRKVLVDPVNYRDLDLRGILRKSSQVGISKIAMSMDHSIIQTMFQEVGFGESTNIGFPGESSGLMPKRSRWRDIERANFAFGYGFNVTNLQLAQAYLVLANNGVLKPLSLLRTDEPVQGRRVMDADVARVVSDMLRSVTEKGGTGTKARIEGYNVAGKTGTVHKQAKGKRGYAGDRYFALFAGMVPAENPRVVAVVTIDEPGGENYGGGSVAAPVFASVMKDALRLLNVPPQTDAAVAKFPAAFSSEAG